MPVPPPLPDPSHMETRLLGVIDMLERAVLDLRNALHGLQEDGDSDRLDGPNLDDTRPGEPL